MVEATAGYGDLSNANLDESRMELQKSLTQLSNKRGQEGTLDDTLQKYDILLEKSRKILDESWAMQAARLRRDTQGNASFSFHPEHDDAARFLADHDGLQVVLNGIKAQVYSLTLDAYQAERDTKYEAMANIQYELLRREADVKVQQAEAAFDAGIQRIPHYNKESE